MREFFENDDIVFYPFVLAAIIAGCFIGYIFATKEYFNEKERLIECLKNEKCLEYVKKYEKIPSVELREYFIKE